MKRKELALDPAWMDAALSLADKARQDDEVPVGAVVVHLADEGPEIIGRGYNKREQHHDPVAHAEILALRKAAEHLGSWRLERCVLVVTLEPCLMCLAACQQARVEQVFYGAQDPKGGAISLNYGFNEDKRLNHRFPVSYFPHEASSAILKEFFKKKRRG